MYFKCNVHGMTSLGTLSITYGNNQHILRNKMPLPSINSGIKQVDLKICYSYTGTSKEPREGDCSKVFVNPLGK